MAQVKFYRGLKEKYNESTHLDGIYFATDTFEIIVNNKTYGGTKSATVSEISYDEPSHKFTIVKGDGSSIELSLPVTDGTNAGLMSAEDKKKLDAVLEGFDPEGPSVQEEIDEIKAYTVNSKVISENPVLNGADIKLDGYSKASNESSIAPTDTVNQAIGKLELAGENTRTDLQNFKDTKGQANGLATLDENGKIDPSQIDGVVGHVLGVEQFVDANPDPVENDKYYFNTTSKKILHGVDGSWVESDPQPQILYNRRGEDENGHSNTLYRWDGEQMVAVSDPIAIGEITGTAYDGAKGKANADAIAALKENTVNGQKITENPVVDGSNVSLTGYSKPSAGGAVAPTDKVNDAIGKLEYDLDTAESTLEQAVQDISDLQEQVTTNKVEAADKSVVVTPSEGQKTTIKVNVKSGDNALKLDAENGLYVDQSALTSYEGKEAIAIADKAESEGVKEISLKINANDKVLTQAAEGLLANINLTWSTADGLKLIGKNSTEIASIPASDFIKDGMLQSVELKVASEDEPIGEATTGTFLVFTFNVDAGSKVINVNVTDLIDVYTASTGIKLEGKNFIAVIDPASEAFLTVGADGIKLSGVQNAINAAKATVDAYTVNAKAISSNPVLSGADITLTGYSTVEGGAVAATDTINQAINKLDDALIWHEA
jgi:hypothetical protein|nr:MAG TPA: hypothetical protein [Caudoviricetes sp.]